MKIEAERKPSAVSVAKAAIAIQTMEIHHVTVLPGAGDPRSETTPPVARRALPQKRAMIAICSPLGRSPCGKRRQGVFQYDPMWKPRARSRSFSDRLQAVPITALSPQTIIRGVSGPGLMTSGAGVAPF